MTLAPGDRVGPYEVIELLGLGGMGEVYRARDSRLQRDVALKILPDHFRLLPHRLARFEREARVLASLNHPNIATLHGIEGSEGLQALVMELVDGETLAQRLAGSGRELKPKGFGVEESLAIARQIMEALEAAHERGIIHRDLKPANIKVRPDGLVKLLDFGLAKAYEPDHFDADLHPTATAITDVSGGTQPGTPAYMSPEQTRGQAVDRGTDIWAFGCVLYEMLTGRRAFDGATRSAAIVSVLEREPDYAALPATTPPAVRRLLKRSLEKDRRRRLRDIADARAELDEANEPPAATTGAPAPITPASHLYRRLAKGGAILIVLILGGTLGVSRLRQPAADTPSRQFVLLPPEGMAFGTGTPVPAFAVSPDGRRLAFVATDRSGRRMLWVRRLDSLDAESLAGTEGASDFSPPIWSPDGSFVAFFADGKLKKVGVGGGGPVTLADAPNGFGGTWSPSGQIVFAPTSQGRLFRISDAGGMPIPVTRLHPTEDLGHVFPQFLPDGRHFLYLVRAGSGRRGIYVGSIDAPDTKRILTTREKARFAPPGYLLFLDDGRLMAQLFDVGRYELSGDPVSVVESVAFVSTEGRASYDVSETRTLVYRVRGLLAMTQPIWVDRAGKTVATVGAPGDYQTASLSPDGSRVAVELHDLRTGNGDIWIIDLTQNSTSRLTFDGMHNTRAVWAPDGDHVVYTGRPDGVRNLHIKRVDGSKLDEPLLPPGPDRIPTDWSPDGRHILFEENPFTNSDLWTLQMPERAPAPFVGSEFQERGGQFSPNGEWVAYVSNETGRDEVYVRSFPGATGKRKVSVNGGRAPRWRHDGKELIFVGSDGAILAAPVSAADRFVSGVPRPLFTTDMRGNHDGWFSTDGKRFLIIPNPPGPVPPAPPITVVLDWTSLLKRG